MVLHCTLVRSPRSQRSAPPLELSLDVAAGTSGMRVQEAVGAACSTGQLSVAHTPLKELTVGLPPLVDGAVLVDHGLCAEGPADPGGRGRRTLPSSAAGAEDTPGRATLEAPPLLLAVHTGPGAGLLLPLSRGRYRLGRGAVEVSIPDPALSRSHAVLDVSRTAINILDAGSANGTYVDGRRIKRASVSTASVIRCGSSTMTICFRGDVPVSGTGRGPGGLARAGRSVEEPLVVRRQADAAAKPIPMIIAALLPVLLGVALAVVTGMWLFLGLTAVSAVTVVAPILGDRGRRRAYRASLDEAAKEDEARRRRAAPSAAELVAVTTAVGGFDGIADDGHEPGGEQSVTRAAPTGMPWLRIGTSDQAANIRLEPPDHVFKAPMLQSVPLTLDPSQALTVLKGPVQAVEGLVRFLLVQWATFGRDAKIQVVMHGSPEQLPLCARFLPGVRLAADTEAVTEAISAVHGPRRVLLLMSGADPLPEASAMPALRSRRRHQGGGLDHETAPESSRSPESILDDPEEASLVASALAAGWHVVVCGRPRVLGPGAVVVDLGTTSAFLENQGVRRSFVPDLVPEAVFDRFCRADAEGAARARKSRAGIPDRARLDELLSFKRAEIARRWSASDGSIRLSADFGVSAQGTLAVDLQADGPHLLVAGTTGAGKSELLRSLVASLALTHSPARVNFIFVDFKGGSGLAPLKDLPHCVGFLTDLSLHEIDRALTALRAEVRRREELFAAAGTPDLPAYLAAGSPGFTAVPHLVIVIDEFRMLVDDAPAALGELMRIATIGRSLGIHLVMATQRPRGALTSDIRANVTTSICLRVQSDLESMDIIGSGAAARIPLRNPGRALLVRGSEPPTEFQTASVSRGSASAGSPATGTLSIDGAAGTGAPVRVQTAVEALAACFARPPAQDPPAARLTSQATGAIISAVAGVWTAMNGTSPHRPIPEPLPRSMTVGDALPAHVRRGPAGSPSGSVPPVVLGLADLPHRQQTAPLEWHPFRQGHLGLIGAPGSVGPLCQAVAAALVTADTEHHLYILDSDGSFAEAQAIARVGAVAGRHEQRRAARILQRLAGELSWRTAGRSGSTWEQDRREQSGRSQLASDGSPPSHVPLVLVVNGWGAWLSAFRSGPLAWAEDLMHDIVRDGSQAGMTVLIAGDRELAASRLCGALPNRVYFMHRSNEESRLAWPARLPAVESVPGRGVMLGPMVDAAVPCAVQFSLPPDNQPWPGAVAPAAAKRPFRIERLPEFVSAAQLRTTAGRSDRSDVPSKSPTPLRLLLGVGGDELEPVSIGIQPGGVLLALGGSGSGKSTLVAGLQEANPGVSWLAAAPHTDREEFPADVVEQLSRAPAETSVILVDDADLLSPAAQQKLEDLSSLCRAMVLTASFGSSLPQRIPLSLAARGSGTGLLLCPRNNIDGEFFGVRYDVEEVPPPGRAVLIDGGMPTAIQLAAPSPAFSVTPAGSSQAVTEREESRQSSKRTQ